MMDRQSGGPGRGPVLASVAVHVVALMAAFVGEFFFRPAPVEFYAIEIELVSPPATIAGEENPQPVPPPDLVVETPDPSPPAQADPLPPPPEPTRRPTPDPPPVREPTPQPEPQRTPQPPRPQPQREPPPEPPREETPPSTTPDPRPGPAAESGMDIQIRMEGLRRDFPEYYLHITEQVGRCFRWQGGGRLSATVRFTINRDGSIDAGQTRTVQSSGSLQFDLTAEGAVECAGTRLRPFPDDLPYDRLPIQFNFRPAGAGSQ